MSRPLPRYTPDTDPRKIERITNQPNEPEQPTTTTRATLPGDTRKLRGIPVIGGLNGTSPGTDPYQALANKQRLRSRRPHRT